MERRRKRRTDLVFFPTKTLSNVQKSILSYVYRVRVSLRCEDLLRIVILYATCAVAIYGYTSDIPYKYT